MPVLAVIAALLATGLVVAGLFFPVHSVTNTLDADRSIGYRYTWWGFEDTGRGDDVGLFPTDAALTGLPLIGAAVLIVLAAVFVFLSGRLVRPGVRTAGRSLMSAGVGVLVGVSALQLIASLEDLESWNRSDLEPGESIEFMLGLGSYLPLGGVALGLVAVVLAHRVRSVRREPATPPMGFRMRQYGPGPMTGQQPALPGPGQSSGRFAPVAPPGERGVGQGSGQFAPVPAPPVAQPPAGSRMDSSTSDSPGDAEPDPDITQRTTVHIGPQDAPAATPADRPGPVQAALTEPDVASPSRPGAESGPSDRSSTASAGATVHETAPGPEPTRTAPGSPTPDESAAPRPAEPPASGVPGPEPTGPTANQGNAAPEAPTASAQPNRSGLEPAAPPADPAATGEALREPASPTEPEPAPPEAARPSEPAPTPSTPAPDAPPSTPEPTPPAPLNLPPAPPAPELAAEDDKDKD